MPYRPGLSNSHEWEALLPLLSLLLLLLEGVAMGVCISRTTQFSTGCHWMASPSCVGCTTHSHRVQGQDHAA